MVEVDYYRKVALAQTQRSGLPGLTRLLMREIDRPVVIVDVNGRVLSWHCPANAAISLEERIILPSAIREFKEIPLRGVIAQKGQKLDVSYWPIGSDKKLGYLMIIGKPQEQLFNYSVVEITSLAAMVEISQQREIAQRERIYRDEFVRDILFNNFDGIDDIVRVGKIWGCDFTTSHIVMVMQPIREGTGMEIELSELLPEIERFFLKKASGCIIGEMAHFLIILLPWSNLESLDWHSYVQDLFTTLTLEFSSWKFDAGVGKLYGNVNMLYRSYQQAKVAMELGKVVEHTTRLAFFDKLGAVRLFYNQSEQDLDEFFQEAIGVLDRHDRENNGSLLTTLWHYLRANRDTKKASKILFIHANTLRYRLKKIEELLKASLENEETRFNIFAALKVAAILGKINPDITKG